MDSSEDTVRDPKLGPEDCSDFHFEECREYSEPRVRFSAQMNYTEACAGHCFDNDNPLYECKSWVYVRGGADAKKCWWNAESNKRFIAEQCNLHRGKVGKELTDFDTCLDTSVEGCRVRLNSLWHFFWQ